MKMPRCHLTRVVYHEVYNVYEDEPGDKPRFSCPRSHHGEYFSKILFWGSPTRFATKITTHLPQNVTGSFICMVIFDE